VAEVEDAAIEEMKQKQAKQKSISVTVVPPPPSTNDDDEPPPPPPDTDVPPPPPSDVNQYFVVHVALIHK
jgi:hypothetical protein